jgi:methionyl-tRNA formyltransferase
MARAGADLLVATLADIAAGRAVETAQAAEGATYARKISPRTARLRWTRPAAELDCKIRGLSPFPGAWFEAPGPRGPVRVKALLSRAEAGAGEPGEVLDEALLVATGEGAVRLLRLQREGRGPQDAADFLRGLPLPAGTKLD